MEAFFSVACAAFLWANAPLVSGPPSDNPKAEDRSRKNAERKERPWITIVTNVNVNVSKNVKVDVSTWVNFGSATQGEAGPEKKDAQRGATAEQKKQNKKNSKAKTQKRAVSP